jgi:hypothetical protein
MPQASTEIPLQLFSAAPPDQKTACQAEKGELSVSQSRNTVHRSSTCNLDALTRIFGRSAWTRPTAEAANPHLAGLLSVSAPAERIAAYLADPFDRATLAMTCRLFQRRLSSYRAEFALFRRLIADKKRIDFRQLPYWKRDFVVLFEFFTQCHWTSSRVRDALDKTFTKLDALYPRVPERVFHEMWPLVGMMEESDATALVKEVVERAKERSPHWAVIVLWEFATRCIRFGERSTREANDFNDMLLEQAIPLWQRAATAKAIEAVIGAIAQGVNVERCDPRIEARWKRILSLLPTSADMQSQAVLGLANSAISFQSYWRKYGQRPGVYFPAEDLLQQRLGGLPAYADRQAFRHRLYRPEDDARERGIELRRHARHVASPRTMKNTP